MYDIQKLNDMILPELQEIAAELRIKGADKLEKSDLVNKILDAQAAGASKEAADEEGKAEKDITKLIRQELQEFEQKELKLQKVEETKAPAGEEWEAGSGEKQSRSCGFLLNSSR